MRQLTFLLILLWSLGPSLVLAQESPQTQPQSPSPASIVGQGIPLSELSSQAADTQGRLSRIDSGLKDLTSLWSVKSGLPLIIERISAREKEDARLLAARNEADVLKEVALQWDALLAPLDGWRLQLSLMSRQLNDTLELLENDYTRWHNAANASESSSLPRNLQDEARLTTLHIIATKYQLNQRRQELVGLQNQVAVQLNRVKAAQEQVEIARSHQVKLIFERDSPSLLDAAILSQLARTVRTGIPELFYSLGLALRTSAQQQAGAMVLPLVTFLCLYTGLSRLSQWASQKAFDLDNLEPVMVVLRSPLATSMLLSLLVSRQGLDAATPRIVWAALTLFTLVPAVVLLRQILSRRFRSVLYALVILCIVDQIRYVAAPLPLVVRVLLLSECAGALFFCLWQRSQEWPIRRYGWLGRGCVALFGIALISNIFGYRGLSTLICNTLLRSGYAAVVLVGCLQIVNAMLVVALQLRAVEHLQTIRDHRPAFRRRLMKLAKGFALWFWFLTVLDNLSLSSLFFQETTKVLTATLTIGTLQLNLGRTLAAIALLWISLQFSKLTRFVLEQDIYPRLSVSKGIPYGVSSGVHYLSVALGILLALSALGIDTTHFTVVAGALSVGLGFGLQNVVNNFISGVILLVERPINVGDTIKLGEFQGELVRVGLRSSVLKVGDGSQVIIPNSELINHRVVNWSGSGDSRRLTLIFSVPLDCSVSVAKSALEGAALGHSDLLKEPIPSVLILGIKGQTLEMQLLAWAKNYRNVQEVRSELIFAVSDGLSREGITLVSSA